MIIKSDGLMHVSNDVKSYYIKIKRKYTSNFYGDFYKPKSNPNCCTNPVGMPVLGQVMLDDLL